MSASTFHGRNELFQPVADALSLLVWIAGPDKLCTYFNKRWLEFTGRPIESEIGDGWTRGVHRRRPRAVPGHVRPRIRSS